MADMFDEIRSSCGWVAEVAEAVHVDHERLRSWARATAGDLPAVGSSVPPAPGAAGRGEDPEHRAARVLGLAAVNFGSGWFPVLAKPQGRSGYHTIATAWDAHLARSGPVTANDLIAVTPERCATIFGQDLHGPAGELMGLFARALADLGHEVLDHHGGSFAALVEAAGGSPAAMVARLCRMPLYRDVATYGGRRVPLAKRAQLTVWDLWCAFGGTGPGRFHDLNRLTMFADNLVPHVLRIDGVLVLDEDLAARIDHEELLAPGSPDEVEIRAVALHAVELAVEELHRLGRPVRAVELDQLLWHRGAGPRYKARPRHRTRCTAY